MKKIYYSSTCDTCTKIIKDLKLKKKGFQFQDIKTEKISEEQIDEMKSMKGTYEALFSRVALKFKTLSPKPISEKEYKNLILKEYTFLRRPVIICDDKIFVGSAKGNLKEAKDSIK